MKLRMLAIATLALYVSPLFGMTEDELRDAIDSVDGKRGPEISLPAGNIVLTRPLYIQDRYNFTMTGEGPTWTKFVWQGPDNQPAIVLDHGHDCELGGFAITGTCAIGIQIKTRQGGNPTSHANWLHDIVINRADNGVFIDSRENDNNNEFHRIDRVRVARASEAGFRIWGANVHRIRFTDCITSQCRRGVWGEYGNHWVWKHGQSTNNGTDFHLGQIYIAVVIDEHRTESSKRFLTSANHWSQMPITLRNIDWAGKPDYGVSVLNVQSNGPFVFQNCGFTSLNGNPIRLQMFDHDPGVVALQGLTINHQRPPLDDHAQRTVIVPDHFDVGGTKVVNRIIKPGKWIEWLSDVRPTANPDHGRLLVEQERETFSGRGDYLSIELPLPATGYARQRSFSVAGDVVIDDATHRTYFADICGFLIRLDGIGQIATAGNSQTGPVYTDRVVGRKLELGTPYRFVLSYDRDQKRAVLAIGEMFGSATLRGHMLQRPPVLNIGGVVDGTENGYTFSGAIRNLSAWDRALTDTEVKMEAE